MSARQPLTPPWPWAGEVWARLSRQNIAQAYYVPIVREQILPKYSVEQKAWPLYQQAQDKKNKTLSPLKKIYEHATQYSISSASSCIVCLYQFLHSRNLTPQIGHWTTGQSVAGDKRICNLRYALGTSGHACMQLGYYRCATRLKITDHLLSPANIRIHTRKAIMVILIIVIVLVIVIVLWAW